MSKPFFTSSESSDGRYVDLLLFDSYSDSLHPDDSIALVKIGLDGINGLAIYVELNRWLGVEDTQVLIRMLQEALFLLEK